jgi:hypothetical protein
MPDAPVPCGCTGGRCERRMDRFRKEEVAGLAANGIKAIESREPGLSWWGAAACQLAGELGIIRCQQTIRWLRSLGVDRVSAVECERIRNGQLTTDNGHSEQSEEQDAR